MDKPLCLLPDKPVGDLVWLAEGEVNECSVCLRFFGDDLDPDALTSALGISPTESCRDIFHGKNYDRIEKTGKWLFSLKWHADVTLEDQIDQLLDSVN